jgi:hypothetical protein
MKDYESLTCLFIKQILKKNKVIGYSKLCKQELVKLLKKTLNNKKMKKGGGGSSNNNENNNNENNNNENNNNETNSLRKRFESNKSILEKYLTEQLNEHQKERINFLLANCLDNRFFKNNTQRSKRHDAIFEELNITISNELSSNPNRHKIIETIRQYIENILSSYANYMESLNKNKKK